MLEFIVTRDGNIKNISIISGLNDECDQEAVHVVSLLEGWEPAVNWGTPVDSKMRMPVFFRPDGNTSSEQKNFVSGIVTEKCTGLLLGGVLVRILETNIMTLTGNDGRFEFEVPAGSGYQYRCDPNSLTKSCNSENTYRPVRCLE
jgi:hypothetical protein